MLNVLPFITLHAESHAPINMHKLWVCAAVSALMLCPPAPAHPPHPQAKVPLKLTGRQAGTRS